MKKTTLIFHGWPQPIEPGTIGFQYRSYFENKGYEVISPNLFEDSFKLNNEKIDSTILETLGGREPDVIVGISLGVLLVPKVALSFPEAKLIFISTNASFKPQSFLFKILVKMGKSKILLKLLIYSKHLPKSFIESLYMIINPPGFKNYDKKQYRVDMENNIDYMYKISVNKYVDIVKLGTEVDNTNILKELNNDSLIFSGLNDKLMPVENDNKLSLLLKNSKEILTVGSHFDAFSDKNFDDIEKFLKL